MRWSRLDKKASYKVAKEAGIAKNTSHEIYKLLRTLIYSTYSELVSRIPPLQKDMRLMSNILEEKGKEIGGTERQISK